MITASIVVIICNDWAIIIMFYAGVHMKEAILDKDYFCHKSLFLM